MIAQTSIIKELAEIGFSPISSLLILGIFAAVAYIKSQVAAQNTLRESWHTDTRHQMEKVEEKMNALEKSRDEDRKRIDDCEDDRKNLNAQVKAMAADIVAFKDCSYLDCPFRLKRHNHQL